MNFLAKIKEIERNLEIDKESYLNERLDNNKLKNLSIERFSQLNIAVEIYSKVLNENIWFCSNQEMVNQLQNDDSTAVCYTADELQKLIELGPGEDFLKKIHNTKSVFDNSKIINTKRKA